MLNVRNQSKLMTTPLLYSQLYDQLSQWITPKDKRHLVVFAENVGALLQAKSGCLSHWLSYLSHRGCQARAHMSRLSYFINNPQITAEIFYVPILVQFLKAWTGMTMILTLDTSMFWDEYCLIEVCLAWGGRSVPLAQKVMKHGSATVSFDDYCPVLNSVAAVLPRDCQVTLLADRGFEHGELMRWMLDHKWSWAIRAKSDLNITLSNNQTKPVADLIPPHEQAFLFSDVTILGDIQCHLATARLSFAQEPWTVITNAPLSLQIFALYGQRFGGIEPHFKDYKSGVFDLPRSQVRHADALARILMLMATGTIIAISTAVHVVAKGALNSLDWHSRRGLSFLQIGLRKINELCYLRQPLPTFTPLPPSSPPPACASLKKLKTLFSRIEFAKVLVF